MDQGEKRKSTTPVAEDADDLVSKRRKVIGPSLPSQDESPASESESESSDDDDFGPSLPPPDGGPPGGHETTVRERESPAATERASLEQARPTEVKAQRDDWMLQPPGAADWAQRVDPTKLKNRKFQTGRSATSLPEGADSSWTETPEQKMRRLQDQVMGVASHSPSEGKRHQTAASSQAMQDKVKLYKEAKAAEEVHATKSKRPRLENSGKDEDDPSSRAFDKEKDMSLSSTMSNAQRRELINKAADFGSRFTSGKFL
ncbi:hypothetical protein BDV59DRAFT_189748 [Aspergillus ambiguus]|uniref:GPALPP motifs-containing protein 1 n=1 Tax=Aspergillus ambiguus TaxID=176160 RepID=UPI003CCE156A